MIELLGLLLTTLASVLRSHQRLLVENLLLRSSSRSPSAPSVGPASEPGTSSSGWSFAASTELATPPPPGPARDRAALASPGLAPLLALAFWALGRPRLNTVIATMARENPHCGTERIRGELLKLGIAVSARSIRRYRRRGAIPTAQPELAHLPRQPCSDHLGS